jgi:hypothetical protein
VPVIAAGVVDPIADGAAQSAPSNKSPLRFVTFVVLKTDSGAVPVESVDEICPVADSVVNAPVFGVVDPIAPGVLQDTALVENGTQPVFPAPLSLM